MITAKDAEREMYDLISSQDVLKTIEEFKTRISKELDFEKLVLFGSRARGDNHVDSDIDIAVVVSGQALTAREKKLLSKKLLVVTFDIELKSGLVINPLALSTSEFNDEEPNLI